MKLRFCALNKIIKIVEEEASLADSLEVMDVENSELPIGSPSFAEINFIGDEQDEQEEFEEERTALNINSISEVKDCADMVAEMFGHIHQNDSASLKFATKLMKGIFHRIQEDEILLEGLEVEHISAYSDALMVAGEYHDAFDLLFFISEYPEWCLLRI